MNIQNFTLGHSTFEVYSANKRFLGLGKIAILDTVVRSGRLPLRPYTQSFSGFELSNLDLMSIDEHQNEVRINLRGYFAPLKVKLMRDHSFDPIHELGDWNEVDVSAAGNITIVVRPSETQFNGRMFRGFSYRYEYSSSDVPLFYLLDQASWEIDGEISGATVFSQSSASDPVVTFQEDTHWSTEASFFFATEPTANPVMTHNLPRWAGHQAFDFQFKGDKTLISVFDRVDLIRSVQLREAGKPELKCFDKHIFDESLKYSTSSKAILLNSEPKSLVDQQNLWTWIYDAIHQKARDEFGLKEQPPIPFAGHHYWVNQTVETYYKDIVPALSAIGNVNVFMENFKKSDRTEGGNTHPPNSNGNMCCSHEFELSPVMGTVEALRDYIDLCRKAGLDNYMWTSSFVSNHAAINQVGQRDAGWYCHMEDTRLKYAGAYSDSGANLNWKCPEARQYWIDCHKKIKDQIGLAGFYIDSHYNLFFMPINYKTGHPQTIWREGLEMMKELQDAGIGWYLESFGPFGQPGTGHPSSYNMETAFVCYYVGVGNDYTTVPVPGRERQEQPMEDPLTLYYLLANKVPTLPWLFVGDKRLDAIFGVEHRRILAEYKRLLPLMRTRYLQEDGQGVLWHDAERTCALLWNFVDREIALPGAITPIATEEPLAPNEIYSLKSMQTYRIECHPLPTRVLCPTL